MEFLTEQTQNIVAQVTSGPEIPVKFNVDSKGFYIVLYPIEVKCFNNVFKTKFLILTLLLGLEQMDQVVSRSSGYSQHQTNISGLFPTAL